MPAPRRLLCLLLALSFAFAPARASQTGEALLERVAVIGASVSAGYGLGKDAKGVPLTLARVVEAGLAAKHEAPLDASTELMFIDPNGSSAKALKTLGKQPPTLVVALDYLFWFGYGSEFKTPAERLAALEVGLKSLEGLACPILLGDFPDMHTAVTAKSRVLPALAVPDTETLAKLNARLAEWAKEHKQVILVPVSKLMGVLLAGEDLRIGPNFWPKSAVPALLQNDGLHTTLEGTVGLWLFAAERLLEARKDVPRGALEPKAGTLASKLAPDLKLRVVFEPIQEKRGKVAPAKTVH